MIVVDTNLLVYLLLRTTHTALADAVFSRDPDWVAPPLIHSEFRNVIAGAVRRNAIGREEACASLQQAVEVITIPEHGLDSQAVLALALESGCTAYDCEFVWLARDLRVPLVTYDRKVIGAFPQSAIPAEEFLAVSNGSQLP